MTKGYLIRKVRKIWSWGSNLAPSVLQKFIYKWSIYRPLAKKRYFAVFIRSLDSEVRELKSRLKSETLILTFSLFHPREVDKQGVTNQKQYNITTVLLRGTGREEARLSRLKKFCKYAVVVQAYNKRGASPLPTEVLAQTLEDGE